MNARRKNHPENHEMSHVAIAALAVSAVVLAGLVLILASRQVHEHPGAVLATILGVPALIVLATMVVRWRREHRA